jgi:hypothetical protein
MTKRGSLMLPCCNICPACWEKIAYGYLNEHLKTCHDSSGDRGKLLSFRDMILEKKSSKGIDSNDNNAKE